MPLEIPANLWAAMVTQLQSELPCEACGFLAGEAARVTTVLPVANALRSPTAFRMEPRAQLQAMHAIEGAGLDLLAIYHSHPTGPDRPSRTDLAEAAYPEALSVICVPGDAGWSARAYWLRDTAAIEEPIVLTQPLAGRPAQDTLKDFSTAPER